MRLTRFFNLFFNSKKTAGLILVLITLISLVLSNSVWLSGYIDFLQFKIGGHNVVHWINDGLMAIFFLHIGLELEEEIYHGELSDIKKASLPIFAAIGGMVIPSGIYLIFNFGTETQSGAGIPMATDIAFAIGVLLLLGNRVPISLKVFLTALAVMDDLGAIMIIAIFYTSSIAFVSLFAALGIFVFLLIINRLKVDNLIPYLFGGIAMWYFMLHSGVHATIAGVLLAFAIPFRSPKGKSASSLLQNFLEKPVTYFILPLFAFANTSIAIDNGWLNGLANSSSLGIILGLIVGKPFGILIFSFICVNLGFCTLPSDLKWVNILGVGFLAGIGFTMSIFITLLAFNNSAIVNDSKIAILIASFVSGLIGFLFLKFTIKTKNGNS